MPKYKEMQIDELLDEIELLDYLDYLEELDYIEKLEVWELENG